MDCYGSIVSAHCRAVFMTAEALGIKLNLKEINLMAGDQYAKDFLKINPQHNIPTINDNGFILNESRAIMMYLANAYGKNDSLYPRPAKQRALVDHRIFFDTTGLFKEFENAYFPAIFAKQPINPVALANLDEKLMFLDEFLNRTKYAAGDELTIADFSIMATLSTMEATGVKLSQYQKVTAYYNKCKGEIKNYEDVNGKGAKLFGELAKSNMTPTKK